MGGEVIDFRNSKEAMERELALIAEQNQELRNSTGALKDTLWNGMSSIIAAATNQFNITSFNPLFQANIAAPLTVNFTFLNYFYKTHGIIQTAIRLPVQDAMSSGDQTGGGVTVQSKVMDESDTDILMTFMEDEGIWICIQNAMIWARLFGGGAIIINDGARDWAKPLDMNGPVPYLKLYAASRWELGSPHKLNDPTQVVDQSSPWENKAALSQDIYNYYGIRLHKSRVITLSGLEAPWMVRWMLQGWGLSEVDPMVEDFNVFLRTRNVLYDLLQEAKTDVFGIEGLRATLLGPGGQQAIATRMQTVQQVKNMNNALIMDKSDLYEQKQITFAGIAEVMKENRMAIASATHIPVSKLYGVGATGFSSGEDDLENYNAMVQSTVRQPLRKPIRQVIDVVMRHLASVGKLPDVTDEYKVGFKPLRVMKATEEEDVKDKKFARVTEGYSLGLVDSKEWGEAVHKDNLINAELKATDGLLDEFPEGPMGAQMEKQAELDRDTTKASKSKEK